MIPDFGTNILIDRVPGGTPKRAEVGLHGVGKSLNRAEGSLYVSETKHDRAGGVLHV